MLRQRPHSREIRCHTLTHNGRAAPTFPYRVHELELGIVSQRAFTSRSETRQRCGGVVRSDRRPFDELKSIQDCGAVVFLPYSADGIGDHMLKYGLRRDPHSDLRSGIRRRAWDLLLRSIHAARCHEL